MKEREPIITELSFEELKLLVADEIGEHQGHIAMLEGLVEKAEFGYENNFRVHIFLVGDDIQVELETKPPIGFKTP